MATDVDICNSALDELGSEPISSLDDDNKRGRLCKRNYPIIRKKMLREHPWNFAIKRVTIFAEKDTFAIGAVNTGTDEITIADHGKQTGQKVLLRPNVGGASTIPEPLLENQTYYIIRVSSSVIKLAASIEDANAGTAIDLTSTGTGDTDVIYSPPYEFEYQFDLPTDYLKLLDMDAVNQIKYQIEGAQILATEDTLIIRYIADVNENDFDSSFSEALAKALAAKIAYSMVQSSEFVQLIKAEAEDALRIARSMDAQEGTPPTLDANEWLDARL